VSAAKTVKEAKALLGPEGFVYEGVNGSGHIVFRHVDTDSIMRVSVNGFEKAKGKTLAQARRSVKDAESASHQFVRYVFKRSMVGDTEQKIVRMHLGRMAHAFTEESGIKMTRSLPYRALMLHPGAEQIEAAARGGNTDKAISTWRLTGPLFGLTDATEGADDDVATGVADTEHAVAAVAGTGVRDDRSARRDDRADEQSEPHPQRDAAADRVGVAGMTLPPELVEQLREALSGDLRAENELLREALSDAAEHLGAAVNVLQAAYSLRGSAQLHRATGHKGQARIGSKLIRRLHLIMEHKDELSDLITAAEMHEFLARHGVNITEGAAGHTLWSLDAVGQGVERVGHGVYRVKR
jgi:hypothetical protein